MLSFTIDRIATRARATQSFADDLLSSVSFTGIETAVVLRFAVLVLLSLRYFDRSLSVRLCTTTSKVRTHRLLRFHSSHPFMLPISRCRCYCRAQKQRRVSVGSPRPGAQVQAALSPARSPAEAAATTAVLEPMCGPRLFDFPVVTHESELLIHAFAAPQLLNTRFLQSNSHPLVFLTGCSVFLLWFVALFSGRPPRQPEPRQSLVSCPRPSADSHSPTGSELTLLFLVARDSIQLLPASFCGCPSLT